MTPGVLREEQHNLERQMGCMNGFFHLFDKHQIFPGKRIYSTRRLPSSSSPATTSPSPSERSEVSPTSSFKYSPPTTPPPQRTPTPTTTSSRSSTTLPLPLFESKDGAKTSWKLREAPRLSLDSRLLDTKRKLFPPEIRTTPVSTGTGGDQDRQIGSPSVVARLMGLEALPKSESGGTDDGRGGVPQLRRSASESRATKEFLQYPFLHLEKGSQERTPDPTKPNPGSTNPALSSQMRGYSSVQKKKMSSFNPQEFFPEPSMKFGTDNEGGDGDENLYVEIEKSLRIPGIGKDLDTLKQILEALHLKGLLHSNPYPIHQRRDQIFHQHRQQPHSPIVLMKPASPSRFVESPPRKNGKGRKSGLDVSDRRGRTSSIGSMSPSSPAKVKKANNRISPQPQSPRSGSSPRRLTPPPPADRINRPPRIKKASSASTKRYSNDEPMKTEEYHEGRNLLERCDKLLHSISEIALTSQQPSPVSVLDSAASFRSDGGICDEYDLGSPCTNIKRWIQFDDEAEEMEEEEEESWGCPVVLDLSPTQLLAGTEDVSQLVHDVLRNDLTSCDGGICGWLNQSGELSGVIIDIERLIFKDLIIETIKSVPLVLSMVRKYRPAVSQRKLLF